METYVIIGLSAVVIGLVIYVVRVRKKSISVDDVLAPLRRDEPAEIPRRSIFKIEPQQVKQTHIFIEPHE